MTSPLQTYYKPLPPPPEDKPAPKSEPSKVYRDPEPPMEMQPKFVPANGPVNPNVGMPGIALAAQRERNKKTIVQPSTKSPTAAELALAVQREKNTLANNKAMMNPSGTAASPSGRVRTGVPFYEVPRGRGMQTPMNLPTPMMGRNPPEPVREPVMPPERGLAQLRQATELPPERAPSPPVMPPEPVMPPKPVMRPTRSDEGMNYMGGSKDFDESMGSYTTMPLPFQSEPLPRDIPMERPPRRILKVGESVTPKNYAKGGMVKASRGDGIAQRGRTRGKLC
jgi:hypothetical protein